MTQEELMPKGVAVVLELRRVPLTPEVPPVPAYHFVITRVGDQYLLEPGFVDLVELKGEMDRSRDAEQSRAEITVNFYVRDKYLCTRKILTQLRDAADEILSRSPELEEEGG